MKARIYFDSYVDIELPQAAVELMTVRGGMIAPAPPDGCTSEDTVGIIDAIFEQALRLLNANGSVNDWSSICRRCGCTDDEACPGGCSWVLVDLCSACADVLLSENSPALCQYDFGVHSCVRPEGHNDDYPHACDEECGVDHYREDQLPAKAKAADHLAFVLQAAAELPDATPTP